MRVNELYFLIFVCGSFGALALALAMSTIRYHRWLNEDAKPAKAAAPTRTKS